MRQIVYVTGNASKLFLARNVLKSLGYEVIGKKIENLPEIQSDSIVEVAEASSLYAAKKLKCAVMKNDSGLVIPALHGFPSAYSHYVEETLGADGILKLMDQVSNREAYFLDAFSITDEYFHTKTFTCKTMGKIALEKQGTYGHGYDDIFIPSGGKGTLSTYPDEERWKLFNQDAFLELVKWLEEQEKNHSSDSE